MTDVLLRTKLYVPVTRSSLVPRPQLLARLNAGLHGRLTLVSAPAGFGKTTLIANWSRQLEEWGECRLAWLSLDEGDSNLARFLTYLVAALQTIAPAIGAGVSTILQSPQPPPVEPILTSLINDMTTISDRIILVLDDQHVIESSPVEDALTFLLEHLPPQMHLVIATRSDPNLPLARYRAQDQLTELRAADLRFTLAEADSFLNHVMSLNLSASDITALETRTEGWVAGLQLAALALQGQISTRGHQDTSNFIQSFTGSHRFVMDYLVEEVLHQQPTGIQTFLLRTSILEHMCGPLCDAVVGSLEISGGEGKSNAQVADNLQSFDIERLPPALRTDSPVSNLSSQEILEHLEQANLFIVPLDNERRWYRYHHLFAGLLRQRLHQSIASATADTESRKNELHIRASQWYEENGLIMEAFQHAAAANDIERAERLIDDKGIPLHYSGGVTPILDWLDSLPATVLNARPSLWWQHAALLLINGQTIGVEEKLQAAEAAIAAKVASSAAELPDTEADDATRNLIGQIAAARATLALTRYDVETMLAQSHRALKYLHPDSLFTRSTSNWTLGYAYLLQGDRVAARRVLTEAISLSQTSGAIFTAILATIGLGNVQEADNQLHEAAETYRRVLQWAGDHPQQIIHEAHLGLGRIHYEWNDLDTAEQHGRQSLQLARLYETVIDRYVICEVFLARLKLAQGDVAGAAAMLAQTAASVRQHNFVHRLPEVTAVQVLTLLHQGNLAAAIQLVQAQDLPLSQARVHLAQGDPAAALAVLEPVRHQAEAKGWQDEQLKVMLLQAMAHQVQGKKEKAMQLLSAALALAEPGGFIRLFVDEGRPMAQLLSATAVNGIMPDYTSKLLAAFAAEAQKGEDHPHAALAAQPLIEPLSERELEVLQLIAQGLSNREIGERLFLALNTVKGHNRRIFAKLQVHRRTEAVAHARELGLL